MLVLRTVLDVESISHPVAVLNIVVDLPHLRQILRMNKRQPCLGQTPDDGIPDAEVVRHPLGKQRDSS